MGHQPGRGGGGVPCGGLGPDLTQGPHCPLQDLFADFLKKDAEPEKVTEGSQKVVELTKKKIEVDEVSQGQRARDGTLLSPPPMTTHHLCIVHLPPPPLYKLRPCPSYSRPVAPLEHGATTGEEHTKNTRGTQATVGGEVNGHVRNPADRPLGVHHSGRHGGWFCFSSRRYLSAQPSSC